MKKLNSSVNTTVPRPAHYGTKPGHFETLKIHFLTSEGVSEVSERANEQTSERCERTSERTSQWPSTYVPILVFSNPSWADWSCQINVSGG